MASTDQPPLIRGLLQAGAYCHPVERISLLETHISWVFLTGTYAYKLKKPVNLGFLDFTSLERRHQLCEEELRLNRRFGSDLYLAVLPVTGTEAEPRMGGSGPPLEYAVQMRQFDQGALLPAALARGQIGAPQIEAFAEQLARFHAEAAMADSHGDFGTAKAVREPVLANFRSLLERRPIPLPPPLLADLEELRHWSDHTYERCEPLFRQRLAGGRVRECHGDLHLGNLVLRHGRIEAFDCLEFAPALRWIDVISDLAFLAMDLEQSGHPGLAIHLLNRWLECSGDYDGLKLWRWYSCYRALVRAKVAALAGQSQALEAYLERANGCSQRRPRLLLICHGLSGSGKSHHSAQLIEPMKAIRLRSDVERKRLFGLWGQSGVPLRRGDPYAPAVSEQLFGELLPAQAAAVLAAGFNAIVDATFLRRTDRQRMAAVAAAAGVPLLILDFQVPEARLRERITGRQKANVDPSDADLSVLERQQKVAEPLTPAECRQSVVVAAEQDPATTVQALVAALAALEPVGPPHPQDCAAPEGGNAGADAG